MNTLDLGSKLGDYMIVNVLGAGGFGVTYQAIDPLLQRHVAIKEYFPDQFAERRDGQIIARPGEDNEKMFRWGLDRFLSEARILARFQHPNVVEVTRYFEANGTAYLVMKFEEGVDLDGWLKEQNESVSESKIKSLILPILDGLQAIHDQGLIHRDVKPQNIMIRKDGTPILIDFGSARPIGRPENTSLTAVISPGYSPPEQYGVDASMQGPWTDIYAVAGVVYRMIAGVGPPDALTRIAGKQMETAAVIGAGKLSPQLLSAVDEGLALDASSRPNSALAFRELLSGKPKTKDSRPQPKKDDDETVVNPVQDKTVSFKSSSWMWASLGILITIGIVYIGFNWWPDSKTTEPASSEFVKQNSQSATGKETVPEKPVISPIRAAVFPFTIVTEPITASVRFTNKSYPYVEGMEIPIGSYNVEVSATDYQTETWDIAHDRESTTPNRVKLSFKTLPFSVNTKPAHASIKVMNIAETYAKRMPLKPGDYVVEVSAKGFVTKRQTFSLLPDSTDPFEVTLVENTEPLTIKISPTYAKIRLLSITDRYTAGINLPPGSYPIEVSAEGFQTHNRVLEHGPGETKIDVVLTENPDKELDVLLNEIRVRKSKRDVTALSESFYDNLNKVSENIATARYISARVRINEMINSGTLRNDLERAHVANWSAFLSYKENDLTGAIESYRSLLSYDAISLQLEMSTLYTIAQLSFTEERYDSARKYLEVWLAKSANPAAGPYILLGQAFYQMKSFSKALVQVEYGLAVAKEEGTKIEEDWLILLNYLYYVQENWTKSVETIEKLQEAYPSAKYRSWLATNRAKLNVNDPVTSASKPEVENQFTIGSDISLSDGDYLPIVRVAPIYPNRALTRGLEGYVILEFVVTKTGTVINPVVIESTSELFNRAASRSVLKYKYKPRVVNGNPVEVPGVRTKVTFEITD